MQVAEQYAVKGTDGRYTGFMCYRDNGTWQHDVSCDRTHGAEVDTRNGRYIVWSGICPMCGEDTDARPAFGTGTDCDGNTFDGGCVEIHEH